MHVRRWCTLLAGSGCVASAPAQLIMATDDSNVGVWAYNVHSGLWSQLTSGDGTGAWGLAADDGHARLFAIAGSDLSVIPYGSLEAQRIGPTTINGTPVSFAGLAFGNGVLYGSRTMGGATGPEGIYAIDPTTAEATLVVATDPGLDLGGIDFHGGSIYGGSDSTALNGRGLYRVALDTGVATYVAFYPLFMGMNQDVDGLAAGDDGRIYFVPDDPGQIGIFNLQTGMEEPSIANPLTTVELFSAGAWAPGLFGATPQHDAMVLIDDAPDPCFAVGSTITYIVSARNIGMQPLTNVRATVRLSNKVTYVSDTGNGVLDGDTLTVNLGDLPNLGTAKFEVTVTASVLGNASTRVTIASAESDANTSNNASTAVTWITNGATLPQVRAVYSTVDGAPTSVVPGAPGERFFSFSRPYRSPNGNRWVISALTDAPVDRDQVVIRGQGFAGTTMIREGAAAPGVPGETIDFIERNLAVTNDAKVSMCIDATGSGFIDNAIIMGTPSLWNVLVSEGVGEVPGIAGETWGPLDSGGLTLSGAPAFISSPTEGPTPDSMDGFAVVGDVVVAQVGVTVPSNQALGEELLESISSQDFYTSASGANWILRGELTGPEDSDEVVLVNGNVVVQEGRIQDTALYISPVQDVREVYMASAGSWMARAGNADGQDLVLLNGRTIAATDGPVGVGSLRWDDSYYDQCFFAMAADSAGNAVVGGMTDEPDTKRDAVLVVKCASGATIEVVREGSPVDLNGDGAFNDAAFVSTFYNDDLFISDSGACFFVAELTNTPGGAVIGEAFLRVPYPNCPISCRGDVSGSADPGHPDYGHPDGHIDSADFFYFLDQFAAGNVGEADLSGSANPQEPAYGVPDGEVDSDDFFFYLDLFVIGCP